MPAHLQHSVCRHQVVAATDCSVCFEEPFSPWPSCLSARTAAPRRTAEHRAARRAREVARRQVHGRDRRGGASKRAVPRLRRQRPPAALGVRHAGRRRPSGTVHHAGGRVAARSLPPRARPRSAPFARTCRTRYYRELPRLPQRQWAGHARVYAMALELIRHSDSRLDRSQLVRFMNSYQSVAPLTIGELWAWPSILKLALIENLRRLAEEILDRARVADRGGCGRRRLRSRASPPSAPARHPPTWRSSSACSSACANTALRLSPLHDGDRSSIWRAREMTAEDAIRSEHQRQAAAQVSIANVLTSLRLCSTLNWSDYFESVSLVEQVLQRDPSGVYGAMDFLSRDRQRQAVEELAAPTGEAQVRRGAARDRERAPGAEAASMTRSRRARRLPPRRRRAAATSRSTSATGRDRRSGSRRFVARRARRLLLRVGRRPSRRCSSPLGLVYAARHGGTPGTRLLGRRCCCSCPPAKSRIVFVQRLVALFIRRGGCCASSLKDGLPPHARTMVIVPVLLTIGARGRGTARAARGHGARQRRSAHSFRDPQRLRRRHRAARCRTTRRCSRRPASGIEALNERFGARRARAASFSSTASGGGTRAIGSGWAGSASAARSKSSTACCAARRTRASQVQIGSLDVLPSVRYCLTLDSDTRLPRDAARKLVGIISHPLNQAAARSGVAAGHPRLRHPAAARQRHDGERRRLAVRAHLRRAHGRRSVHHGRLGSLSGSLRRRHLHRQGPLRRRRVHGGARRAACPRTPCCRTTSSKGSTRGRRSSPTSRSWTTIRRACSRTRGGSTGGCAATGRSCCGSFPFVPTRTGLARNRLPLVSRWKILDNLRRSLVAPATLAASALRLDVCCPAIPRSGRSPRSAALTFSPSLWLVEAVAGPRPWQPWRVLLRNLLEDTKTALARAWLQLTFLAYQACQMTHAIVVTLVRVAVTHRKMLEWQTAAARPQHGSAARSSRPALFVEQMLGSPLFAAARWSSSRSRGRARCRRPLPILLLWIGGAAARVLSSASPLRRRRQRAPPDDRRLLRLVARKTWRYFDTFVGSDGSRVCRPTTVQETPEPIVAHRTSPTNIGMSLLAALAAHDLGFIRHRRARRADRRHADHDRGDGALRGSPLQLVRLADAWRRWRRGTSRRWTAATSRRRCSRWRAACASSRERAGDPTSIVSDLEEVDDPASAAPSTQAGREKRRSALADAPSAQRRPCRACAPSWSDVATSDDEKLDAAGRPAGDARSRSRPSSTPDRPTSAEVGHRLLGAAAPERHRRRRSGRSRSHRTVSRTWRAARPRSPTA